MLQMIIAAWLACAPAFGAGPLEKVKAAKTLEARLTVVRAFKSEIRAKIARAQKAKISVPERLSLHGYRIYFNLIDDRAFARAKCDDYRVEIIGAFSPKNDEPEVVPYEARQALDVLALLCER